MNLDIIAAVLSIVIIDLTLSGDNAVVIGMAAHRLPPRERRIAVLTGAGGAILLRVIFAVLASVLLSIPFLQAAGGLILVWIAYKLLIPPHEDHSAEHKEGASLLDAVRTIVLADVVMSLDNILAVGGASHGNVWLLLFGLALSMPIVIFGSTLVASLMNRAPWLMLVGSLVLVWTAGEMITADPALEAFLPSHWAFEYLLIGVIAAVVLALSYHIRRRRGSGGPGEDETGRSLAV